MSYRGFGMAFRRRVGMSVIEYVHRRRIELACQRLQLTRHIAGSARDAGFNDVSHFYPDFRRHLGYTPK